MSANLKAKNFSANASAVPAALYGSEVRGLGVYMCAHMSCCALQEDGWNKNDYPLSFPQVTLCESAVLMRSITRYWLYC